MRPWVLNTRHVNTSLHLEVTRTVRTLARFFWLIGMDVSTRRWIRRCLHCHARKTSRIHHSLAHPLPPFAQRLWHRRQASTTPGPYLSHRAGTYTSCPSTDRFSRHTDLFAVSANLSALRFSEWPSPWRLGLITRWGETYSLASLFRIAAPSTPFSRYCSINFVIILRPSCGLHTSYTTIQGGLT